MKDQDRKTSTLSCLYKERSYIDLVWISKDKISEIQISEYEPGDMVIKWLIGCILKNH